jgi:hypothetical protein
MLFAEVDGLLSSGALFADAIHPDSLDSQLGAFVHKSLGLPEWSHEENTVNRWTNAMQRLEAFFSVDVFREEVDGHHVVALLAHFAKQASTEIFGVARYAHHRDAVLLKKIINLGPSRSHESLPAGYLFVAQQEERRSDSGH